MVVVVLSALAEPTCRCVCELTQLMRVQKHPGRTADRQDARVSRHRLNLARSPLARLVRAAPDRGPAVTKALS